MKGYVEAMESRVLATSALCYESTHAIFKGAPDSSTLFSVYNVPTDGSCMLLYTSTPTVTTRNRLRHPCHNTQDPPRHYFLFYHFAVTISVSIRHHRLEWSDAQPG